MPYLIALEIFDPLEIACDPIPAVLASPKLGPGKLPSPPAAKEQRPKRGSGRGAPKAPEEQVKESVEKLLEASSTKKTKKKAVENEDVTIDQLKKKKKLNGRKELIYSIVPDYYARLDERKRKIKQKGREESLCV